MKKCRKILSVLLVGMLIAVQLIPILNVRAEDSLVITTYGENEEGINPNLVTNTANLIVSGIANGDEFSAYKIIDIFYDEDTNEMTYDFTSQFRKFLDQTEDYGQTFTIEKYFELTGDNPDGSASSSVITTSTLNVLVSKYATYIRSNDIKSTIDMLTSESNAMVEVEAGAYLILPKYITTSSEEQEEILELNRNLYGVMVGNVVFSVENSKWKLNDYIVYTKNASMYNLFILYGNVSILELMDLINSGEGEPPSDFIVSSKFSSIIGKKHALVGSFNVPQFPTNSINKYFKVKFNIPEGITYDAENIYLMGNGSIIYKLAGDLIRDENNTVIANVELSQQSIIVNIDLNTYSSSDLSMFLGVELNSNANVGHIGNEIITEIISTDDPYVEGSYTTFLSSNIITTYGLELTNLSRDDSTLLKGAKYEIYSKYTDSVLSNKIGEFTVGDDGKGSFPGVPSGTVYLKQVKAPTGYQLIKEPIAVKIATEDAIAGTKEGYYQVITYNDAMWYLPSTGGIGTILYTVIGLLVIGISTFTIIYLKKKQIKLTK